MFIEAVLLMLAAGLILGLILGLAAHKLVVIEDPLIPLITELLPGYNCGACGYPGCANFAVALVEGDSNKISKCVPSSADQREAIKKAFDTNPNAEGEIVKVNI